MNIPYGMARDVLMQKLFGDMHECLVSSNDTVSRLDVLFAMPYISWDKQYGSAYREFVRRGVERLM